MFVAVYGAAWIWDTREGAGDWVWETARQSPSTEEKEELEGLEGGRGRGGPQGAPAWDSNTDHLTFGDSGTQIRGFLGTWGGGGGLRSPLGVPPSGQGPIFWRGVDLGP